MIIIGRVTSTYMYGMSDPHRVIQPGVHFAIIKLFRALTNGVEQEWFWIKWRVYPKDMEGYLWCGMIIATANYTDEENQISLVIIFEGCKQIYCVMKWLFSLNVTWHLTDNKFVKHLQLTRLVLEQVHEWCIKKFILVSIIPYCKCVEIMGEIKNFIVPDWPVPLMGC